MKMEENVKYGEKCDLHTESTGNGVVSRPNSRFNIEREISGIIIL
jgi:hypothetical protein